jgi:hypothetical protein
MEMAYLSIGFEVRMESKVGSAELWGPTPIAKIGHRVTLLLTKPNKRQLLLHIDTRMQSKFASEKDRLLLRIYDPLTTWFLSRLSRTMYIAQAHLSTALSL